MVTIRKCGFQREIDELCERLVNKYKLYVEVLI